jgi:hypothetical protein
MKAERITAHAFAKLLLAGPDVVLVVDDDYRLRTLRTAHAEVREIYSNKSSGRLTFYSGGDDISDPVPAIIL